MLVHQRVTNNFHSDPQELPSATSEPEQPEPQSAAFCFCRLSSVLFRVLNGGFQGQKCPILGPIASRHVKTIQDHSRPIAWFSQGSLESLVWHRPTLWSCDSVTLCRNVQASRRLERDMLAQECRRCTGNPPNGGVLKWRYPQKIHHFSAKKHGFQD